jgi:ankyrin repeat protein
MALKKISATKMCEAMDEIYKYIHKHSYQDIIKVLEKRKIDMNTVDVYGQTLLWALISKLNRYNSPRYHKPVIDAIPFFLEQGSDINHRDVDGNTVLWLVAQRSVSEGVEPLIKGGAFVENANNNGSTPLYAAVVSFEDNQRECFTALLKAGANPYKKMNVEKFFYKSPFDFAERCVRDESKTLKEKFRTAMNETGVPVPVQPISSDLKTPDSSSDFEGNFEKESVDTNEQFDKLDREE